MIFDPDTEAAFARNLRDVQQHWRETFFAPLPWPRLENSLGVKTSPARLQITRNAYSRQPPQPSPPKKPRDGDQIPSEPKIKAGVIAPNIGREARDDENKDVRPTTPLKPGRREAGRSLGQRFARLGSPAAQERLENVADAISHGISEAHVRDMETAELSQDAEWLTSLGFGKPNR